MVSSWIANLSALGVIMVTAYFLVRAPRSLRQRAGGAVEIRREVGDSLILLSIGAIMFGGGLLSYDPTTSAMAAIVIMTLAAIALFDRKYFLIPDAYTAIIAIAAILMPLGMSWQNVILGAVVCGGLLRLLAIAWKRRTDSEGMGFGDIKLGAAIGGLLGWESGLWAITLAAIAAALITWAQRTRRPLFQIDQVAYGAYLSATTSLLFLLSYA